MSPDPDESDRRLGPLVAMIQSLSPTTREELEAALAAMLGGVASGGQIQDGMHAHLLALLEAAGTEAFGMGPPWTERRRYDETRPEGAPKSRRLVSDHGSWLRVCKAAWRRRRDARAGFAGSSRQGRRPADYQRDEVVRAVRRCQLALGRTPSSSDYYAWVRRQRYFARERGAEPPRLPTQKSVERHFKGWAQVRAALAQYVVEITSEEDER